MRLAVARICVAVSILVAFAASGARGAVKDFVYLSPLPGSRDVSPGNNVAIRPGDPVDPSSVSPGLIRVVASRSGTHAGTLRLATDGLTLVFRPDEPYALHETVHVRLGAGLRTRSGRSLPGLDYVFQVSPVDSRTLPRLPLERDPGAPEAGAWWREPAVPAAANVLPCDTLLAGFPTISLVNASAQLPGVYFVAPFNTGNQSVARLEVIDDRGKPLFERQFANNFLPVDFKVQGRTERFGSTTSPRIGVNF